MNGLSPSIWTNPNAGDFVFQMESQLPQQLNISFVSSLLSNREELVFKIEMKNLKIGLKGYGMLLMCVS